MGYFYGEALIMGYKSELWDRLDYGLRRRTGRRGSAGIFNAI
jgi:hypothetical protein